MLILLMKAKPIKNGMGLHQEMRVDRTGRRENRWVKGAEAKPAPRQAAHEEPQQQAAPKAKVGESVAFEAAGVQGKGKIVAAGKDGATVKDGEGKEHPVYWHEMKAAEPAKPDYAPREAGENDKAYAKRVVDKGEAPTHLPEEHERYFNTEGSTKVPIANLHSTKTDEENQQGGDNGPKRMLAAYHGALGKRDPITVMPHKDQEGHYEVVDGNGTMTSAKKLGWQHLPVKVVNREEGGRQMREAHAQDLAKATVHSLTSGGELPKEARQPVNDERSLYRVSKRGLADMKQWLDEGNGICDQLGHTTMQVGPDDADMGKPGGMLFIAPLKGKKRARQKVRDDYGGDWSKLLDTVRCTIAVDTLDDLHKTAEALKAGGLQLAKKPKDRMTKPTAEGYRDIMMNVRLKNGMVAEVQLHLKSMLPAKTIGHHHYNVTRELIGKHGDTNPVNWPPEDNHAYSAAIDAQRTVYKSAWDAAVHGGAMPVAEKTKKQRKDDRYRKEISHPRFGKLRKALDDGIMILWTRSAT